MRERWICPSSSDFIISLNQYLQHGSAVYMLLYGAGIVFFSLMIGIGLVMKPTPGTQAFKHALHGLFEICMRLIGIAVDVTEQL